ncbi:DUF3592 domain-containing protein [Sanguibacter hominis ATCC BAA-789]|uniref:DUF3592 domain-containing protein n=1 Tax=Sanguibacter hominis ATCC BAA-789 TaxID=1312740 RepID=A0A9X5FCR3_9MICO|nr:DUF3592 domain-containing protein [Sanguibacter hominis]NKX93945.1 DUF3592 domain-containing protein [Sanguibacter hominis ATCC BAA-789]
MIGSAGVGVVLGLLVWIGLLVAAIVLIVKGAQGRKQVPRVAVEGRVVQRWQLGGNAHTIEFDYPMPDGTWRRSSGRLPMFFKPYADGQPITVYVDPSNPHDAVVDPEKNGNSRAMFAGVVLLILALAIGGMGGVALAILAQLPR